jgi:hypothetical protein
MPRSASYRPPPQTDAAEDGCPLGVLERNRTMAQRIGRVMRSASGLAKVAIEEDPASLRAQLGSDPQLLACDAADVDLAIEWADTRFPNMQVMAWTSSGETVDALLATAKRSKAFAGIIGWPSFASMPRPWEIALATRRLVDREATAPKLGELFTWGATSVKFRPRTTRDRDHAVAEISDLSERAGAQPRVQKRIAEVAHEMLMNAMYDAPVDSETGAPLYAHDRKQDVSLSDQEAPTFRFATDGVHVALQVVDPFGRLTRDHVIDGILRGRSSTQVLDTSNGGAGLGLYQIYSLSTVLIIDVSPQRYASVTSFFDLDVAPREARGMPVSLHLFDR